MKRPPEIERWLPPVWTLNCLGNAILIYLFLTEKDSVQPSYERIVLNHSSGYIPRGKAKEDVVELIRNSNYPKITREAARSLEPRAHPLHTRYVCACMHPETPSCLENFISSMIHECRAIWQFFGVFGLAMVLLKRRAGVVKHPWAAYKQWVSYTVSSTLFAAGSITTAWGFVCFWQRLLPGTSLPRIRIMLGGIVSSLWILVLPPNRRKDISLYVARFAILNAYQTIKAKTSFNIPYGEVPLFALALTSLLQTKQSGNPVERILYGAFTPQARSRKRMSLDECCIQTTFPFKADFATDKREQSDVPSSMKRFMT
ncbi:hypothetical protein BKA62DRAFT_6830 [Auriculariales sp. MPI-PUGE-AT-0066]|nr:hypothetical protein BKA62DRAFT_6830 [Auriculariales sp. MPI-PUGE-AT-0066]